MGVTMRWWVRVGCLRQSREYEERRGRTVQPGDGSLAGGESALRAFVADHRRRWVLPREYVLSHVDGIQALATTDSRDTWNSPHSGWVLTGHVDLEDFAFMDARLPLAGYELHYEGPERRRQVPPEFWSGYRRYKEPDPTYPVTRNLFQLFYLLAWTRGLYRADHPYPTHQEHEVRRYAHAILSRATHP